jgi:uncharacterized membrane protein
MRAVMAAFYIAAGVLHLSAPADFVRIVPDFVPWRAGVVFATGLCEIAGAIGLMTPPLRRASGVALAAYAICVFPANIKHAIDMIPVGGLPQSWWYHGPRLAAQPVLVWWALFCSGVIDWPAKRRNVI